MVWGENQQKLEEIKSQTYRKYFFSSFSLFYFQVFLCIFSSLDSVSTVSLMSFKVNNLRLKRFESCTTEINTDECWDDIFLIETSLSSSRMYVKWASWKIAAYSKFFHSFKIESRQSSEEKYSMLTFVLCSTSRI